MLQCDHSCTDGIRQVCLQVNLGFTYGVRSLTFGYVYNYISIPNGLSFTVAFLVSYLSLGIRVYLRHLDTVSLYLDT